MQKILFVIDSLQTGGAERSILDITSKLKLFKPIVCHLYKNDFLKNEFEERGVQVISLNIGGRYNFVAALKAFRKLLAAERPAIVVATLLRAELISRAACKLERIPNVGTFVNDTYSRHEWRAISISMKVKVSFFWILNVLTARWCVGFLSNSESIKLSNCRALFVPREKVKVIYRGRNPEVFKFSDRRLGTNDLKFLSVGRLLYRKGYAELITAFANFNDRHRESTLTIAGEGPFREQIEQMIADLNLEQSVVLLGNVQNVADLFHGNDVLVFPSHYEGFSGTLVEAMFSGIPIIASDIAMNREAIDESMARLFPVKNIEALADQMEWIHFNRSSALQLAACARVAAQRRFTIDIIVRQHEAYYRELIEHHRN